MGGLGANGVGRPSIAPLRSPRASQLARRIQWSSQGQGGGCRHPLTAPATCLTRVTSFPPGGGRPARCKPPLHRLSLMQSLSEEHWWLRMTPAAWSAGCQEAERTSASHTACRSPPWRADHPLPLPPPRVPASAVVPQPKAAVQAERVRAELLMWAVTTQAPFPLMGESGGGARARGGNRPGGNPALGSRTRSCPANSGPFHLSVVERR